MEDNSTSSILIKLKQLPSEKTSIFFFNFDLNLKEFHKMLKSQIKNLQEKLIKICKQLTQVLFSSV